MNDVRLRIVWLVSCLGLLASCLAVRAAEPADPSPAASAAASRLVAAGTGFAYDREYPFIGYSGMPQHNDVAHLEARMKSAKVKLEYREPRGYLDSLLLALRIDPDSQSLVFSKTSLQTGLISPETPRAIYFNDDTYVAWISHSSLIEISTMDSMMGAVFYTMSNQPPEPARFERETLRCLNCHDTFFLSGGGVPSFLFLSAYTRREHEIITKDVAQQTTDATALADRWGGWYVTGSLGGLQHLGDILPSPTGAIAVASLHRKDIAHLDGLFDTTPYLTDTSDVVALLVLEHQVYLHNLIIRANYKSRMWMERLSPGSSTASLSWEQLPVLEQGKLAALLEPLVRAMLFVDAATLPAPIRGGSGFARSFEARGPRDAQGRSLRDLDLHSRLFKYPLSFLIYSEGFDYLPLAAREFIYRRLAEVLTARSASEGFSSLSAADRGAIFEILRATKPGFVRELERKAALTTSSSASTWRVR